MASLTLCSMASSSTSTSHDDDVYNVFINHRGPDVKKNLASHIYHRLTEHGLKVFLDQTVMQGGEGITRQIKRAIRSASVHIAIFSEGYAGSPWCLNELLDMLDTVKSGSAILPVFYNVQPSDLRRTQGRGVYARALSALQQKRTLDKKPRYDSDTIEKWRKALSDVSLISGFDLNACNGDEGQLVDEVVQRVLKKVPKGPDVRSGLASHIYRRRIGHEYPTIVPQQPGEVQLDPHDHISHVEAQQPGEAEVQLDPHDHISHVEAQQPGEVQLDPHDHIIHVEAQQPGEVQTILQTQHAYSEVLKTTSTIYKIFLSFYGIMQVGILTVVFSSQQRKALCKDSWRLLVLSAIVSGGVLIAFLWNYCEQFLLLRRGRRLIQELHSSGISAVDLKVDDLEINTKYWSWIRERAAIVIAFMTLSICLWFSFKSRLSC